jgi:hypothetical protein
LTDVSEVLTASIIIALMMEAVGTSETSNFYQITRRNIPEDIHLHAFIFLTKSIVQKTKKEP